jgi:hypothetical protein
MSIDHYTICGRDLLPNGCFFSVYKNASLLNMPIGFAAGAYSGVTYVFI